MRLARLFGCISGNFCEKPILRFGTSANVTVLMVGTTGLGVCCGFALHTVSLGHPNAEHFGTALVFFAKNSPQDYFINAKTFTRFEPIINFTAIKKDSNLMLLS